MGVDVKVPLNCDIVEGVGIDLNQFSSEIGISIVQKAYVGVSPDCGSENLTLAWL